MKTNALTPLVFLELTAQISHFDDFTSLVQKDLTVYVLSPPLLLI